MAHRIQCRLCHTYFDTEQEEFVLVGQKSYYHKDCYENWIKQRDVASATGDELFWKESVIDFLYRDIKMAIDFAKFEKQWNSFVKPERKMTPKGIYFTLRYHFIIQHGDKSKALGGIGIVPSIYSDAVQYWANLEAKKEGTLEAIMEQIKSRASRPQIEVKASAQTNKKAKWDLSSI